MSEREMELVQGHILYMHFEVTNDSIVISTTVLHKKLCLWDHMS